MTLVDFDAYLKQREEGFQKGRGSRRKKRKIIELVADDSSDAKKAVEAAT